jgi:Acetyltransferase (GNAT) domain
MDYEKVSYKEWEEIIQKSDNTYFFSSPTWAKIIGKTYNEYRTATRLYHINDKSILIPMMEKNTHGKNAYGFKSYESMPEGWSGLFSESEITTDEFTSIVKDIIGRRNTFYLALPPFENISPGKSAIKDEWKVKDEWNYMHILNLEGQDFEDIWKNYRRDTKRKIRKAIKSGVEIKDATSLDDYRDFYKFWSQASQNWQYQDTHSFKFFSNLHKYGSPHVKLSLATKDNTTIAGILSFYYTNTIFWYFSAFKSEYGKLSPTSLLLNNLIEQACQEDYKYINFGLCGNLEGLISYKEGFGAEPVEIERYSAWSNGAKTSAQILNKIKRLTIH